MPEKTIVDIFGSLMWALWGPLSGAEQVQNFVHDLVGSHRAQGWDNQLSNEPAFEAIYETKWRLWNRKTNSGLGFNFISHLGGRVGNIAIYTNTGAEFRLGFHLPQDFGSCPIRPGCIVGSDFEYTEVDDFDGKRFAAYFFSGFDGRFVLRDIFYDGNTLKSSHSVEKEILVADVMAGIGFNYDRFRFTYSYILRTKEFESQKEPHVIGAFNVSYKF